MSTCLNSSTAWSRLPSEKCNAARSSLIISTISNRVQAQGLFDEGQCFSGTPDAHHVFTKFAETTWATGTQFDRLACFLDCGLELAFDLIGVTQHGMGQR